MENVKYSICYWYAEWEDMGAKVPTCNYYKRYGECPCNLECKHFITKREIDDIVRNMGKSGQMSDLIYREDAIKPFCVAPDGTRIPEVDCDNFPVEFSVEFIKKHLLSLPPAELRGDLISREDAIEALNKEYRCTDKSDDWDGLETAIKIINALPSAEYSKPLQTTLNSDLISREDAIKAILATKETSECGVCYDGEIAMQTINSLPPAETDNRHYIKIYADDEPSVKAEKLYQICGETQNREVAEWLKEYFPLVDAKWIPVSERLPSESGYYLVTREDEDWRRTLFDYYSKRVGRLEHGVVAWMPLPAPYKKRGRGMKEKTARKVRSREDETYSALINNNYANIYTILYEIATSLGRIADILTEANGHKVEYDSENESGDIE